MSKAFCHACVFFNLCFLHSWETVIFLRLVRWPPMHRHDDHWWTLDFASAFLSSGVNRRAELVPSLGLSPTRSARGSGLTYNIIIMKECYKAVWAWAF
jgi:hypothetical protein